MGINDELQKGLATLTAGHILSILSQNGADSATPFWGPRTETVRFMACEMLLAFLAFTFASLIWERKCDLSSVIPLSVEN